jgi:hypothetical protein
MFSSGILDFAVGLVFTFLVVSLAAGAATEALSSFMKTRSTTLLQGVKDLLNESNVSTLAAELYQHALVNPRGSGGADSQTDNPPAYIQPDHFAAAFLDIIKGLPDDNVATAPQGAAPPAQLQQSADTQLVANPAAVVHQVEDLKAKVDAKIPPGRNDQIRNMLHGIIDRAGGAEDKVRAELASWFDNAMDRVGGVYKRWTQVASFAFALAIAMLLNISAIDIATSLWSHPVDTTMLTGIKPDDLKGVLASLHDLQQKNPLSLPIGWPLPDNWHWWTLFFGWIITAFASLFGAPFWFDALQKIVRLKGSGPSPADKAANTAASN